MKRSFMGGGFTPASAQGSSSGGGGGGGGGAFDPAKLLAQMGWTGGGLGKQGEGIVNPIEVKLRPERAGIAFGGLKEKTKQAKDEARRRGEDVSSDEEDGRRRASKKKVSEPRFKKATGVSTNKAAAQAWTVAEREPRKPKVEHRTYEEILQERGHAVGVVVPSQVVLDASGKEYSSISDALAQHAVPTSDTTQLVEIQHNLRLICDGNKVALDTLATEGAAINDRQKWLQRDRDESVRRARKLASDLARVDAVLTVVQQIEDLGRRALDDSKMTLDAFTAPIRAISTHFVGSIAEFELDAAIVGAIYPIFRRAMTQWSPLQDPKRLTSALKSFSDALRIGTTAEVMTPYDALMWSTWMPPVRSALNNEWDVRRADAATTFFAVWQPLLPQFIRDNVTQQLILPKLRAAVSDWDGKQALYKIVFPWMPVLGQQMDDVVHEAKRRIRNSLKTWKVSNGIPSELAQWRDLSRSSEWSSMLLHHVVDKLSSHLQHHFRVEPAEQDMAPLNDVLAWRKLLGSRITSKLLLARFAPPWLKVAHAWLSSPDGDLEEMAMWYEHWKAYLHDHGVAELDGVRAALTSALGMMEQALQLEPAQRSTLRMPDLKALQRPSTSASTQTTTKQTVDEAIGSAGGAFRLLIEEAAAEADLLVQSLNRTERSTGMPLYRLSRAIDGKRGVTFYVDDDVAFAEQRGFSSVFEPVSVDALIKSATKQAG